MELLKRFAILTLVTGTLLSLLPDGSIRRTAAMAAALLMLLYWAEGVGTMLQACSSLTLPASLQTPLIPTGESVTGYADAAADSLLRQWEAQP
ncbi:MAG: hypothetical protein IJ343_11685 [Clostridia bacterium]|nr:hypothetical protein [Clostridia bacterium]